MCNVTAACFSDDRIRAALGVPAAMTGPDGQLCGQLANGCPRVFLPSTAKLAVLHLCMAIVLRSLRTTRCSSQLLS